MVSEARAYDFSAFAATEEYRAVNDTIVRRWVATITQEGNREVGSLLDIATGAGTMLQLFLKYLPGRRPSIICIDQDAATLARVQQRLGPELGATFIHASVEDLDLPPGTVDVAVWGNGIHYLEPEAQERTLRKVGHALSEGGWFLFNSAFYAGSRAPESMVFYRAQIRAALGLLHALGIRRDKRESRPPASDYLPREHYEDLLARSGFVVHEVDEVAVRLYQAAIEHISSFYQYAAGALHGYPPEAAADAMRDSVAATLEKHGQRDEQGRPYLLRSWLAVTARRPPRQP